VRACVHVSVCQSECASARACVWRFRCKEQLHIHLSMRDTFLKGYTRISQTTIGVGWCSLKGDFEWKPIVWESGSLLIAVLQLSNISQGKSVKRDDKKGFQYSIFLEERKLKSILPMEVGMKSIVFSIDVLVWELTTKTCFYPILCFHTKVHGFEVSTGDYIWLNKNFVGFVLRVIWKYVFYTSTVLLSLLLITNISSVFDIKVKIQI
jgi:hypothetical protein